MRVCGSKPRSTDAVEVDRWLIIQGVELFGGVRELPDQVIGLLRCDCRGREWGGGLWLGRLIPAGMNEPFPT
jgi:hypothetical protein